MTRSVTLVLIVFVLGTVHVAGAQTTDVPGRTTTDAFQNRAGIGVALKAGTLGAGLEFSKPLSSRIGTRLGVNYFSYVHNAEQDVKRDNFEGTFVVDGHADMFSVSLLADFYPFKRVLRFSAGLVYNGNEISVAAAPLDSIRVTMNDADVYQDGENLGQVGVDISWAKLRPYVGIGLGNASVGRRIQLLADVGVIYAGAPNVEITTEDGSWLERNRDNGAVISQNLEENVLYRLYPVVSLGFSVRL